MRVARLVTHPLLLSLLDGGDLLSHHRQHLNVDAVELVETRPGTRTENQPSSASEHAKHAVVKGVIQI